MRAVGCDGCLRMNAYWGTRRLIEQRQCAREIVVRILGDHADGRGLRQRLRHQNRGRAAVLHFGRVLRIREERQLGWAGLLQPGHACDFDRAIALERAAELRGEVVKLDTHGGHGI